MKYSVIVPAFNAEKTIVRCLESLCSGSEEKAEILIINDGSTDSTKQICTDFAARKPHVHLFSTENRGVSSARNTGLDHAVGDFILFVDADDCVEPNYFSALDTLLQQQPDFCLFEKRILGARTSQSSTSRILNHFCVKSESVTSLASALRHQKLNLVTTKVFRRVIIEQEHLRFDEKLSIGEDKVFSFRYALAIRSVLFSDAQLYCMSIDDASSLSRKKRTDLCENIFREHEMMNAALRACDLPEQERKIYDHAIQYSFYRSAYTAVASLRKHDLAWKRHLAASREILGSFRSKCDYHPSDLPSFLVSVPVRLRMVLLTEAIISISRRKPFS